MSPSKDELTQQSIADNFQIEGTSSDQNSEAAPLLASPSSSRTPFRRHSTTSLNRAFDVDTQQTTTSQHIPHFYSLDESQLLEFIMEKVKNNKFAYYVDKLAVESEPGLTNAQLMLNNRRHQNHMTKWAKDKG
jgi:NCS1 family nucleobase:cation symporter-1